MKPAEKKRYPGRESTRGVRPSLKALALPAYLAFLMLLLGGIEGAARVIGARSANQDLRMILYDYGRLAQGDSSRFRFVPDPALSYRLKPGFEFRSRDGLEVTRHNASGFRANDDFPPRTEGTLRVICLGASTTYGVGVVDNAATYPAALERFLNADFRPAGWKRVEVFNLGVGGYTSREVLMDLRLDGLPLEPDVVLIQCAINDVTPRFYADFDSDYEHFRKPLEPLRTGLLSRIAFRSHLVLMTGWKLGLLEPLTLQSRSQYPMPPVAQAAANLTQNGTEAYRRNLAEAVDLAKEAGAHVWLLTEAHMFSSAFRAPHEDMRRLDQAYRRGLEEHNEVIRDLATSATVGLIDLERAMPSSLQYFTDPIHMSEEGNRIKARLIAQAIHHALPARGAGSVPR